MLIKIKNIYLTDKEGLNELENLTGEEYSSYGGIIFEGEDGKFYEHTSTDPVFPFAELK